MSHENNNVKQRQALWFAKQGMHVFMLRPGKRIPVGGCDSCRSSSPQYIPHTADDCECLAKGLGTHCHGSHAATTDPRIIKRWWTGRNENAGIGIHLAKSGLIMLDIDSHKNERVAARYAIPGVTPTISLGLTAADGWDSIAMLAAERDRANPCEESIDVKVLTPSGGLHIWYRVKDADRYRNIDGKLAWQVDVKAGAAFAVAPGTEVTGKGFYRPMGPWGEGPQALPAWLDAEIKRVKGYAVREEARDTLRDRLRANRNGEVKPPSQWFVNTVMGEAVEAVQAAPGGQRNAALNAAAFKVGRALVSRDATLMEEVSQVLQDAATAGGTPAAEARATVASGIAGGVRAASK